MYVRITVKFECKKKEYIDKIAEIVLQRSKGSIVRISNIFRPEHKGVYYGSVDTAKEMASLLRSYYESGEVTYYEVDYCKQFESEHIEVERSH